jgi:drug/metabolite transporter (DMT)-like permease
VTLIANESDFDFRRSSTSAAATVLLAVIAVVARPSWPRGRNLLGSVLYGLFGFAAFYALAYFGLVDAPAGVARVLIAGAPLLTLLLAVVQRLEKFRWQGLVGSLIAAAGIAVIFGNQLGAPGPALIAVGTFWGGSLHGRDKCLCQTHSTRTSNTSRPDRHGGRQHRARSNLTGLRGRLDRADGN